MPKGGTYRGGIVDGEKSGLGQFEYRNGDRYEGQFARDEYNGFGVYSFANGGLYQGQVGSGLGNVGPGARLSPTADLGPWVLSIWPMSFDAPLTLLPQKTL